MQLDSDGNIKSRLPKGGVRHAAKIGSESFLGDDDDTVKFSGYEHQVGEDDP